MRITCFARAPRASTWCSRRSVPRSTSSPASSRPTCRAAWRSRRVHSRTAGSSSTCPAPRSSSGRATRCSCPWGPASRCACRARGSPKARSTKSSSTSPSSSSPATRRRHRQGGQQGHRRGDRRRPGAARRGHRAHRQQPVRIHLDAAAQAAGRLREGRPAHGPAGGARGRRPVRGAARPATCWSSPTTWPRRSPVIRGEDPPSAYDDDDDPGTRRADGRDGDDGGGELGGGAAGGTAPGRAAVAQADATRTAARRATPWRRRATTRSTATRAQRTPGS